MDRIKLRLQPHHLGVPSGVSKMICWAYGMFGANHAPILHWHWHCLQIDKNEISHDPRHLGVPSGASKMISEHVVRSVQSVHLLASRLALSPNRMKQASTWASSPRSTIWCIQNDLWAYGTFGTNHGPVLHDTHYVSKWTETRFHKAHVTKEFHRVRTKWFLSLWYVRRKLYTYLTSRLALSPNGLNQALTLASSLRSTIGCVQNDCWAYGMFGANRAPILHWH
jgi:hypothetical protein